MNWQEYEDHIIEYYINNGYNTKKTTPNFESVDIFVSKNNTKAAIQIKMFDDSGSRKLTPKIVRDIYAAKVYYDCNKAIIVIPSENRIKENTLKWAKKLNVEIKIISTQNVSNKTDNSRINDKYSFDNIWKNQILPLEGKIISNGRISNKIVKVNLDGITRLSSNNKESFINIEIFRSVINHIIHDGSITRSEVNDMYLKRGSSGIFLILSQVDFFELSKNPLTLSKKYLP